MTVSPGDVLRRVARRLFGDYNLSWIYEGPGRAAPPLPAGWRLAPVDAAAVGVLGAHPDPLVRRSASFAALPGVAIWDGDALVGAAFFDAADGWRDSGLWPVFGDEAVLADLLTLPEYRGRGAAPLLIAHGAAAFPQRRLLAWVWWTNRASMRAFDKAGWRRTGRVAVLHPFGSKTPLRFGVPAARRSGPRVAAGREG